VRFPVPPFNVTIWPTASLAVATNAEIVRVTAISTDTLTILRAQEGSTARTILVGDLIAVTITAKALTDIETDVAALGVTTAALGVTTTALSVASTATDALVMALGTAVNAAANIQNVILAVDTRAVAVSLDTLNGADFTHFVHSLQVTPVAMNMLGGRAGTWYSILLKADLGATDIVLTWDAKFNWSEGRAATVLVPNAKAILFFAYCVSATELWIGADVATIAKASGVSHAPGLVPDPPSLAGTVKFLREDMTYAIPPGSSATPAGVNVLMATTFI
jgi:hypothetical protein